jgi:hypothetical protein
MNQIGNAVHAAVDGITGECATRRIMLFIAQPADDWHNPLGLTCAQILPRKVDGRWHLDFHYVWRTVEALVGLPFSAFASIRQSQDILNAVNAELTRLGKPQASMGRLVYIALSLHLFTDEGDDEIARTVVANAYA